MEEYEDWTCINCERVLDDDEPVLPVMATNIETGEETEEYICLKCSEKANNETGGYFLGRRSVRDMDFSHYLANCSDKDCTKTHLSN